MKIPSWNRRQFRKLAGPGAFLVGACLAAAPSAVAQQTNAPAKPTTDTTADADLPELDNWVEFGVGGSVVSGDKAQYQSQSGLPANTAFGGIQSFHYETPVEKKGLFTIDGRGMFDNHDYDIKLEVQHPDTGYVTAGFRQYREYYDGTGGYLPSNGLSFPPSVSELWVDRGTAFFEAGLTLPDWPVLKIRYEHDYRTGTTDSTEWGTTTLTGPGQTLTATQEKIAPAFRMFDEKTDFIAADLTHTIGDTDFGLGLRYELIHDDDSQNVSFFPDQGALSHTLTQTDGDKDNMINAHGFTDTHLNDKFEFTTGYSYTSMRDYIFGNRLDSPATTTSTDTRYANLGGASDLEEYEMDLSLMWSPMDDVYIVPAFRVEKEDTDGSSEDNSITGVNTLGALSSNQDDEARLDLAQSLDARYTGITNWVFYVRGEWEQNRSDLQLLTLPTTYIANDWHQLLQQYSVGANWYPLRGLNFAAQYYHKFDNNDYENTTATPTAYPGFISQEDFNVDDVNFRVTWRPFTQLTLVSRYDFQYSTIDMQGFGLASIESGNNTTHQLGETISWSPFNRVYLQLGGNVVLDTTHTPVETLPVTAGIVQESKNDYWTINGSVGYALDDKTQLRATYVYFRSPDYTDNSPGGLPYGAGGTQDTVSATLERQVTRKIRWMLQYGFTSYRDDLFGGNLDYTAHTILSSVQYRF